MSCSDFNVSRRALLAGFGAVSTVAFVGPVVAQSALKNLGVAKIDRRDGKNILMIDEWIRVPVPGASILMLHPSKEPAADDLKGTVKVGAIKEETLSFLMPQQINAREYGSAVVYDSQSKILLGYFILSMEN